MCLPRLFEEGHGEDNTEFFGESGKAGQQRVVFERLGKAEVAVILGNTEIRRGE